MIKPAKAGFFVSEVWWWGLHAIPLRRAAPGFMHSGGQPVAIAWSELGRRVRGYGGRREPIHGGSCETSMFRKSPRTPAPADPRRCVGGRGRSTAAPIIFERYQTRWRSVPSFGNRRYRPQAHSACPPGTDTPFVSAVPIRTRPSVGGGRRAAPVGTVKNMDVFAKPPWMGLRRVP